MVAPSIMGVHIGKQNKVIRKYYLLSNQKQDLLKSIFLSF